MSPTATALRQPALRTPAFTVATGGMTVREWLRRHNAIDQLLTRGFAELSINPEFLEHHAPRVYNGLVGENGIVNNPLSMLFRTERRRDDELGEDMESALMHRQDDEHKNQFHYHVDVEKWLNTDGAPTEVYHDFWSACDMLDYSAYLIAQEVGRIFDLANAGQSDLERRIKDGLRITRVLDYLPNRTDPKAADAKVHFDRGTLTVHWESTEPGLVVFDKGGTPHKMNETNRGTVLLFWGRKLGLMYEHLTDMVGTVHGVRDTERTTRGGTNRRAIVSFVHSTLTPAAVVRYREHKAHYKADPARYPL